MGLPSLASCARNSAFSSLKWTHLVIKIAPFWEWIGFVYLFCNGSFVFLTASEGSDLAFLGCQQSLLFMFCSHLVSTVGLSIAASANHAQHTGCINFIFKKFRQWKPVPLSKKAPRSDRNHSLGLGRHLPEERELECWEASPFFWPADKGLFSALDHHLDDNGGSKCTVRRNRNVFKPRPLWSFTD